jgi:hypothetical protein
MRRRRDHVGDRERSTHAGARRLESLCAEVGGGAASQPEGQRDADRGSDARKGHPASVLRRAARCRIECAGGRAPPQRSSAGRACRARVEPVERGSSLSRPHRRHTPALVRSRRARSPQAPRVEPVERGSSLSRPHPRHTPALVRSRRARSPQAPRVEPVERGSSPSRPHPRHTPALVRSRRARSPQAPRVEPVETPPTPYSSAAEISTSSIPASPAGGACRDLTHATLQRC